MGSSITGEGGPHDKDSLAGKAGIAAIVVAVQLLPWEADHAGHVGQVGLMVVAHRAHHRIIHPCDWHLWLPPLCICAHYCTPLL